MLHVVTTLVTFFQTLNLFQELHIDWPESILKFFRDISSWITLLNFNIDVFHAECSLPMTFEQKWLLQVLSPMAFCALALTVGLLRLGVAKAAAHLHKSHGTDGGKLEKCSEFEWRNLADRVVWLMLLYLTVGYVTLVQLCLNIFKCKTNLDGVSYLVSNPSLACQGQPEDDDKPLFGHEDDFKMFGNYGSIRLWAQILGVLYGLGVPLLFICIMVKNRKRLKHKEYLKKYGILSNKVHAQSRPTFLRRSSNTCVRCR